MPLSKDEFLAACAKPRILKADIPGVGEVLCRIPTCREFERFTNGQRKRNTAGNGLIDFHARAAVLVVCKEDGTPMFMESDVPMLSDLANGEALIKIHDFIAPYLGWSEKAIEDEAKNLQATTGEDSTTD